MTLNKNILVFISVLIATLAIWYFSSIVVYIIIAAIVALLGRPIVDLFKRISIRSYKVSDTIAASLTLFVILIVILSVFSLFIPLIIKEARIISSINSQDVLVSFHEPISTIQNYLTSFNLGDSSDIQENIRSSISSFLNFANLSSFANSFIGTMGNIIVGFVSVMFMAFFFLKDKNMLPDFITMLTPEKHVEKVKNIISHTREILLRYFFAILIQSLVVTILIFIGLSIVGVENALIIAFLSGLLNIIPYVGPLIAACIGIVIGVSTNLQLDFYTAMLPFVLKIVVVYAIVQFADNFFLQPYIFSNTVKAHPLEIFIVILLAGTVAGMTGMIIAIPAYGVLRIIAREFFSNFRIIKNLTEENNT